MYLSEKQKRLIKLINEKEIKSVLDLIMSQCEYKETKNSFGEITKEGGNIYPGDTIYVVNMIDDIFFTVLEFMALCDTLEKAKLIYRADFDSFIIPNFFVGNNYSEFLVDFLKKKCNFMIVPSLELESFIKNDYITTNELELIREQNARKESERFTKMFAILSLFVSLITAIGTATFNYITYTKERNVFIRNLEKWPKIIKVKIINDKIGIYSKKP